MCLWVRIQMGECSDSIRQDERNSISQGACEVELEESLRDNYGLTTIVCM